MKCKRCKEEIDFTTKIGSSGHCRKCYMYIKNEEYRARKIKKELCIICSKPVTPRIVKLPMRCDECREKIRKYTKKRNSNIYKAK
jgi:hypothetical protein